MNGLYIVYDTNFVYVVFVVVMNSSALDLRDFDIAPDSPTSVRNLHLDLDEFDDASQLQHVFCRQMSSIEFEQEGVTETEKALQVKPKSVSLKKSHLKHL